MKSTIDVVVPTYNRGDLVLETLESLLASRRQDFSVWIIDQSTDQRTKDAVTPFLADQRLSYIHSVQKGSNQARNFGIALGNAPIVAFTDDDCIVGEHWLDETLQAYVYEEVDAVFGRIIDKSIGLPGEFVTGGIKIAVKNHSTREIFYGNRFKLSFGHGANMSFRRSVLESVNGFDPLLGNGGPLRAWPERDIGYRILAQNGVILYEPNMVVQHKQWRTWSGVKAAQKNYAFGAGAVSARYLKSGDLGGLYLLVEWILDQGVRQVISGVLKWRSWQKISAGLIQIFYPIPGFFAGLWYPPHPKAKINPSSLFADYSAEDEPQRDRAKSVNKVTSQLN